MAIATKEYLIGTSTAGEYDGAYLTFAAYETAKKGNLVTAQEKHILYVVPNVSNVGGIVINDAAWVTSADCCIEVKPQLSSGRIAISDTMVRAGSVPSGKSYINAAGYAANIGDDLHVFVDGLLLLSINTAGTGGVLIGDDSPAKFTNCILRQEVTNHAGVVGFKTGSGFLGVFINCYVYAKAYDENLFATLNGFDVDCATRRDAIINCTAYLDSAASGEHAFLLNNYARAVNCLGLGGVAGGSFATDGNGDASVKCCASNNTTFSSVFAVGNYERCIEIAEQDESLLWNDVYNGEIAYNSELRKAGCLPDVSGTTQDAFGKNRIKYDIGYYQTNLINIYDLECYFKDLGSIIKSVNKYITTIPDMITDDSEVRVALMGTGIERLTLLSTILSYDKSNRDQVISWANNLTTAISNYISNQIASDMMCVSTVQASILAELDYWLGVNSQSVNAIRVENNVIYDLATDSEVTLGSLTIAESVKQQRIKLICTSNGLAGSEYWSITGSEQNFDGTVQTGVAYLSSNGLGFTLSLPTYSAWSDAEGTYHVNDIVLVSGIYYRCVTEHTVTVGQLFTIYESNWEVVYLVSVGDEIEIDIMTDDEAVFQSYFRDYLNFCFTNSNAVGGETILDTWAE